MNRTGIISTQTQPGALKIIPVCHNQTPKNTNLLGGFGRYSVYICCTVYILHTEMSILGGTIDAWKNKALSINDILKNLKIY